MTELKIGDLVVRKRGTWYSGMVPGDTDTIVGIEGNNGVYLRNFGHGHSSNSLEKISSRKTLKQLIGDDL